MCRLRMLVSLEHREGGKANDLRAPAFRSTVKRYESSLFWAASKNVFCLLGFTVFSLLKARPSRPSMSVSEVNSAETSLAASTAMG